MKNVYKDFIFRSEVRPRTAPSLLSPFSRSVLSLPFPVVVFNSPVGLNFKSSTQEADLQFLCPQPVPVSSALQKQNIRFLNSFYFL